MKNTFAFPILLVLNCLFTELIIAQSNTCGIDAVSQAQIEQNLLTILHQNSVVTRGAKNIPVNIHIVGKSNGENLVKANDVLDMLCGLNKNLQNSDFHFYLDGDFNYILSDSLFNMIASRNYGNSFFRSFLSKNAINVFFTETILPSPLTNTIIDGFYSYTDDFIVIKNSSVNSIAFRITHEIGHFFSLLHTYYRWDDYPYNPMIHGIKPDSIAPGTTNEQNECMNGKDCEKRGDHICDTPPDYNFGETWEILGKKCSKWDLVVIDPCNDTIKPMQDNAMSSFINCKQYRLTPMQLEAMYANYALPKRDYIRNNITPLNTNIITQIPQLIAPLSGSTTQFGDVIEFDWSDVPNATNYILEVSEFSNFNNSTYESFMVDASQYTLKSYHGRKIYPSVPYYWRVKALNNGIFCNLVTSTTASLKTGTLVSSKELTTNDFKVNVFPNPATTELKIDITLPNYDLQSPTEICLISAAGAIVKTYSMPDFAYLATLDISDVDSGFYEVQLRQNGKTMAVEKVVVVR